MRSKTLERRPARFLRGRHDGEVIVADLYRCACPERVSSLLSVRASERRGASIA
jgi:hypothetical protein